MDCYPEYKHHNHHHYQPPSSVYSNVHHPYYNINDPLRQSSGGYLNDTHHQYYPDGYSRHHQHFMHHGSNGSYPYEANNEHNSQFYNGYSNAHQPCYYEHPHLYESYRNSSVASSNAYRYHHFQQQQQQQQSAYNLHQIQNHPQNFYHHHQQHPAEHFNRYSTPQHSTSPVYHHNPMRPNSFLPTPPTPVTPTQYESERTDNKLLNNDVKHMESITSTQQSSPSVTTTCSNPVTHSTSTIAKINDSVDKNEAPIDDSGNDQVQQVKSETIPKALTPRLEGVENDNENRIKSESELEKNIETVNSNKSNDECEDKNCNSENSNEIKSEENDEKNQQSENGCYEENNRLQNDASSLSRPNNFHQQQEEAATGKKL